MFKNAADLAHSPLTRQKAPFRERGRSERGAEPYPFGYRVGLKDARAKLGGKMRPGASGSGR